MSGASGQQLPPHRTTSAPPPSTSAGRPAATFASASSTAMSLEHAASQAMASRQPGDGRFGDFDGRGQSCPLERQTPDPEEKLMCGGVTVPCHAFWMVCFIVFIDSLGGSISAPVLPFYAKEFDCTTGQIGFLFSAFSLAQVVCLPVMGKLSDIFGRRRVLVGSLFGAAVGAWGQGLAPSFSILLFARAMSGACGAVGSTANVYVSDITTEAMRGQYLGYLMNSNGAAFAFGPGLGGGLSRLGLNAPIEVNGLLCLVAGVMASFYLPESPVFVRHQQEIARLAAQDPNNEHHDASEGFFSSIPKAAWAVCLVEFLRGMSFSAIFTLYGVFALQVYDLDSLHIGFAVCVGALTLICTNVWLNGPLEHRVGEVNAAALGTVVMAAGEVVLAYAPTLELSLLGMWSVYMGQAIAGANIAAMTSLLATDDNRGEVMSMQQTAQAVGRVVGPIFLGHLFELDCRWPFACAAAAVLLSSLILLSLRKSVSHGSIAQQLAVPLLSSPKVVSQAYTKDDVFELGTYLCDLLSEGGYQWQEMEQREKLKRALACYFPPIVAQEPMSSLEGAITRTASQSLAKLDESTPSPYAPVRSVGADVTYTGDDSNFLRSPLIGRRPYKGNLKSRPHRRSSL